MQKLITIEKKEILMWETSGEAQSGGWLDWILCGKTGSQLLTLISIIEQQAEDKVDWAPQQRTTILECGADVQSNQHPIHLNLKITTPHGLSNLLDPVIILAQTYKFKYKIYLIFDKHILLGTFPSRGAFFSIKIFP